jgi:hypothetical protein
VKQVQPSFDQGQCFDGPSDLGVYCRCVSVAAAWLQGVRRLFAAFGSCVIGSELSVALPVTISERSSGTLVAEWRRREKGEPMRRRGAIWLAWGICGTAAALAAVTWLLRSWNAGPLPAAEAPVALPQLFDLGVLVVFCLPAALIVSRRPRSPIGWFLASVGIVLGGLGDFAYQYGFYTLVTNPGSLPGGVLLLWIEDALWAPLVFGPIPLLLLLFPNGRLPSRSWRPIAWTGIGAVGFISLASALYPRDLADDPRLPRNPTGIHGWANPIDTALLAAGLLFVAVLVASGGAVVSRFRRAKGVERQQLKWFAYGAAALMLTFIGFLPLLWNSFLVPILVGFGFFTGCIAVAVLRHHLYDIDRLINRTLVYGLLTLLLGLCYAGAVLVLGQFAGHQRSNLVVAGATLAVAAVFQPARRRIQEAVDQRFNRRKYNAAKTIETFSARLRDEVELDTLSVELLAVVDQTMEPTTASLWLRPSVPAAPHSRP